MDNKSGIWITGASSGIGKAVASEFAAIGCNVFVSARRVTELERLKQDLGKLAKEFLFFRVMLLLPLMLNRQ